MEPTSSSKISEKSAEITYADSLVSIARRAHFQEALTFRRSQNVQPHGAIRWTPFIHFGGNNGDGNVGQEQNCLQTENEDDKLYAPDLN